MNFGSKHSKKLGVRFAKDYDKKFPSKPAASVQRVCPLVQHIGRVLLILQPLRRMDTNIMSIFGLK